MVIDAIDAGRVEQRRIQPGQSLTPETVLLDLSSPPVQQECLDALAQLNRAQADLSNLRAQLEDQRLNQESLTTDIEGQYLHAKAQYDAEYRLSQEGLIDATTSL